MARQVKTTIIPEVILAKCYSIIVVSTPDWISLS